MGCDIHTRAEVRIKRGRREALQAVQAELEATNLKLRKHNAEDFGSARYAEEAEARLRVTKEALIRQRQILVEDNDEYGWVLVGRDFGSAYESGPYLDANRETLETCTDGELLDAFVWETRGPDEVEADWRERQLRDAGRAPSPFFSNEESKEFDLDREWTHKALYEALSEEARMAFMGARNRVRSAAQAERALWAEADAKFPPTEADKGWGGRSSESVAYFCQSDRARITRERERVNLAPEVRENIIAALDGYRPWAEEGYEGWLTLSYNRGLEPIMTAEPYNGRNYALFAKLADVRNDGTTEALSEPRGLPDDLSAEGRAFMESYGVDGHSHTWFTLDELMDADFEADVHYQGCLTVAQWEALQEGTLPESWSMAVYGRAVRTFTPDGYDAWVEHGKPFVPLLAGRSWRDGHPKITPEVLDDLLAGRIPYRRLNDHSLIGGGHTEGVAAPPGEEPFGLALGDGRSIRVDTTGELVCEFQHPYTALLEAVDQIALEELRRDVAEQAKSVTPEQIISGGPELDARLERLMRDADEKLGHPEIEPYIYEEWDSPPDVFAGFVESTIPSLKRVAEKYGVGYDDVRFLAFFDN